ncbi:MAG TPA: hypothetical protein VMP01_06210 [Pirellulaceae bacterium]|nr:hypothetical protein [Pirellulaceae bacterium]
MAVFCETYHEEADLGSLSKSELDDVQEVLLRDLITTEPAIVLQAAVKLGWSVSPPVE